MKLTMVVPASVTHSLDRSTLVVTESWIPSIGRLFLSGVSVECLLTGEQLARLQVGVVLGVVDDFEENHWLPCFGFARYE